MPVIPQGLWGFDTDPRCWEITVFLCHLKLEKTKSLKWGDTTLGVRFSPRDVEVWFVCQFLLTVICHTDAFWNTASSTLLPSTLAQGLIQNLSYCKHPVAQCPVQLPHADAFRAKKISKERKDLVNIMIRVFQFDACSPKEGRFIHPKHVRTEKQMSQLDT